jgi:L-lactate utilization protein LutB
MADQAQRERESREEDLNKFHQLREEQEEERAKLAEDLDEELEEEE